MTLPELLVQKMIHDCRKYQHDLQSKHISAILLNKKCITKFHYNYRRYKVCGICTGTIHAEMNALKELLFNSGKTFSSENVRKFSKYSIVVLRVNKKGELLNSKPCLHCLTTLKSFNINKVYYSNNDGKIDEKKIKKLTTEHMCSFERYRSKKYLKE